MICKKRRVYVYENILLKKIDKKIWHGLNKF